MEEQEIKKEPELKQTASFWNCPLGPKCWLCVLIGLILLIVAFLIGFTLGKSQTFTIVPVRRVEVTPIPTLIITPTPTPDPIAGWRTYRNEKYKYEVKYLGDWDVDAGDSMSDKVHWATPEKGLEVPWVMDISVEDRKSKSVSQWIARDQFRYEIIKAVSVEGHEGIIVSDPMTMGNSYVVAFFPSDGYMYSVGIASDPPKIEKHPVELLELVLSTFKFLD